MKFTATTMIKTIFLLLALSFSLSSLSKVHNYYTNKFQRGANSLPNVKRALHIILNAPHQIIKGQADRIVKSCDGLNTCRKPVKLEDYREARKWLFGDIHLRKKENRFAIKGLYCDRVYTNRDFPANRGIGKMKIPDHHIINTEHIWPQSRFQQFIRNGKAQKSSKNSIRRKDWKKRDLHILYPTNSDINSSRGSYEFADVEAPTKRLPCGSQSKIGFIKEAPGTYFEPPQKAKGNVARALFYFSIRYNIPISKREEETLRKWHKLDPVSNFEKMKNQRIYELQHVRNPFVDMPQLVDKVEEFQGRIKL